MFWNRVWMLNVNLVLRQRIWLKFQWQYQAFGNSVYQTRSQSCFLVGWHGDWVYPNTINRNGPILHYVTPDIYIGTFHIQLANECNQKLKAHSDVYYTLCSNNVYKTLHSTHTITYRIDEWTACMHAHPWCTSTCWAITLIGTNRNVNHV